MKLEVIDKRNPVFIRVATVADTDDHRIKVSAFCCGFALPFVPRRLGWKLQSIFNLGSPTIKLVKPQGEAN